MSSVCSRMTWRAAFSRSRAHSSSTNPAARCSRASRAIRAISAQPAAPIGESTRAATRRSDRSRYGISISHPRRARTSVRPGSPRKGAARTARPSILRSARSCSTAPADPTASASRSPSIRPPWSVFGDRSAARLSWRSASLRPCSRPGPGFSPALHCARSAIFGISSPGSIAAPTLA